MDDHQPLKILKFQSTPSPRRATLYYDTQRHGRGVFQSTPSPRRATFFQTVPVSPPLGFQSTPSPRRATEQFFLFDLTSLFQSTPSPRRATQLSALHLAASPFQSTPSPRRATITRAIRFTSAFNFNPRPPRGGRRKINPFNPWRELFQSTPSPRRATAKTTKFQSVFCTLQRKISKHRPKISCPKHFHYPVLVQKQ